MYAVRKCSSFILLQVVDQLSKYHLLNEVAFSPLYILASFVKDKVSIGMWIYLWDLYFVPLIYISVFEMHISEKEMQFKVKVLEHLGLSIVIFFPIIYIK